MKNKEHFSIILKRAVYLWPALIYMVWFILLENYVSPSGKCFIMHCFVDDLIPFNRFFIIPYYFWFAYIAIVFAYFLFTSEKDFKYCCRLMFSGMITALLICTILPNGQDLRPDISSIPNDFCGKLVKNIYMTDTPTNVFPSVHVYNSCAACVVIWNSDKFRNNKIIKSVSAIISVTISLSTMFVKQHSALDVTAAIILCFVMYMFVYKASFVLKKREKEEKGKVKIF